MNLQKRMALMKMKASLLATLPRNTKERRKLKKERQGASCLERFQRQLDLQKGGKEGKKEKAVSLGLYRTILHCCWVCIKWHSWLKVEGCWVEGNTEIHVFNGLISSRRREMKGCWSSWAENFFWFQGPWVLHCLWWLSALCNLHSIYYFICVRTKSLSPDKIYN